MHYTYLCRVRGVRLCVLKSTLCTSPDWLSHLLLASQLLYRLCATRCQCCPFSLLYSLSVFSALWFLQFDRLLFILHSLKSINSNLTWIVYLFCAHFHLTLILLLLLCFFFSCRAKDLFVCVRKGLFFSPVTRFPGKCWKLARSLNL